MAYTPVFTVKKATQLVCLYVKKGYTDQLRFLGNCPPTPPLSQRFALSEKLVLMLAQGRGRLTVSQKSKLIRL